jgi:coatomer protein complex subunit epsilon
MQAEQLDRLRELYYLGVYDKVLEQTTDVAKDTSIAGQEAATLRCRALLAQGRADEAVSMSSGKSDPTTVLGAAHTLALYIQARRAGRDEAASRIADQAKRVANGLGGLASVLIGQLLTAAGHYTEAVAILGAHRRHLECVLVLIQTYLAMGRVQLAQNELAAAKAWAEDALLIQLAEAWVNLVLGGERCQSTAYIFDEFGINASLSANALCGQAVCHLMMQQYPEAEGLLREAQSHEAHHPDVLANLIVTARLNGQFKEAQALQQQLEQSHPEHPFIRQWKENDALFDRISATYAH